MSLFDGEFGWTSLLIAIGGGYVLGRVINSKEVDIGRQKAAKALMEQVDQLLEAGLPTKTKTRLRKVRKALQAVHDGEGDETLANKVLAAAKSLITKTWEVVKSPFTSSEDEAEAPKPKPRKKKVKAKTSRKSRARS